MEKELANAKTEKEKAAIKEKYEAKIEKAESSSHSSSSASKPAKKPSTSGSSSSSGSSASKPQTHTHSWQPVYETVTKYRTEYIGKYVCESDAGTRYFDTNGEAHQYYVWCGENGYGCNYYWDEKALSQQVPYTEQVLSYYKCSCGATK